MARFFYGVNEYAAESCLNLDIQVMAFSVSTLYSYVAEYQRFRRTLLPPSSWWRWQHDCPELWYPTTSLHGVTTQKTTTWILIPMQISSLA